MKAVVYETFGGPMSVCELPDPEPPADGVVVAVDACGLCRSDWHGWRGHDVDVRLPQIPGHELAGRVVAVGPEVTRWQEGARVTVPFSMGCGGCTECAAGHPQVCERYYQPGFTGPGAFATLIPLPHADQNLVALPDAVDSIVAASLGCRFGTAFRAVVDQGRVTPREWVAVLGCGGLGLSAVQIARAHDARVVAVDVREEALALASALGAELTLDARGLPAREIGDRVHALTGGGAHVAIEALGSAVTAVAGVHALRRRGRFVQVGVLAGDDARPELPMPKVMFHELEIIGSHGVPATRYSRILELVGKGRLRPERLVARTIPLEEVPAALADLGEHPPTGITVALPGGVAG